MDAERTRESIETMLPHLRTLGQTPSEWLQKSDFAEQSLLERLDKLQTRKQLAMTTTRVLWYRVLGRHLHSQVQSLAFRVRFDPSGDGGLRARARLRRIFRRQVWWQSVFESHQLAFGQLLECEMELEHLLQSTRTLQDMARVSLDMERLAVTGKECDVDDTCR